MSFRGRSELLVFDCELQMGAIGTDTEYLPERININASFAFAYNVMEGYYEAYLAYTDIRHRGNTPADSVARPDYNLTGAFSLQCDRQAYSKDPSRFDSLRAVPLTESETYIYRKNEAKSQTRRQLRCGAFMHIKKTREKPPAPKLRQNSNDTPTKAVLPRRSLRIYRPQELCAGSGLRRPYARRCPCCLRWRQAGTPVRAGRGRHDRARPRC